MSLPRFARTLLLLLLLASATLPSCRRSPVLHGVDASVDEVVQPWARSGKIDLAFAVVSDTHFGFKPVEATHEKLIPCLNAIEGSRYPLTVAFTFPSRTVPPLRGLLVTGDLTDAGIPYQWEQFERIYGFPAEQGRLRFPTYEVMGNHDRWVGNTIVEKHIAERHGGRFYSFDWDTVHFLALGEAPDEEGLAFVAKDLAHVATDAPLVVYFHLPLAGPSAAGWWFADGDSPGRLAKLLEHRTVLAFFHGHDHSTGHYLWHGYDVFRPGAVKQGKPEFSVVHVTDKRFALATYDYEKNSWGETFVKTWR